MNFNLTYGLGSMRFEVPDKRKSLTFKVPTSLKADLGAIVKLWKILAKIRGADPDDIDMTYVCNRLLDTGKDDAWAEVIEEFGLDKVPETDLEWKRLETALKDAATAKISDKK